MAEDAGEAVWWLRLCDEDREEYGGPEWVCFDARALYKARSSKLEQYEDETGMPVYLLLRELTVFGARATRYALFIARREAGMSEKWDKFDPHTNEVKRRYERPAEAAGDTKPAEGRGKQQGSRAKAAPSRRGSAGAPSAKSSTKSARS